MLSSAALATERSFGNLALPPDGKPPRRVLVGGLGFGMTARGVLDVAGEGTRVTVVEKVGAIPRLVRGQLAHIANRVLDDPRVEVVEGDVSEVIASRAGNLDAILLDVDNGPHWASFRSNARLYTRAGLLSAKRALRPGGAYAVWSGYRADPFLAQLRGAGFAPSVVPLAERGRVRARAYVGR